jgi:acetylornithine deacetylase/succinyl-diaminopimelate desuccinylase-like protein
VPGSADFTIDVRAVTDEAIAELERHVEETVATVASEEHLEVELKQTFALDPVALDTKLVDAVERAAESEGASSRRLPSGAGHDAMLVARRAPTAMIFVPSREGISHAPEEYTSPEHAELGMRVLAATLRETLQPDR